MAVSDILDNIQALIAASQHLPLTSKLIIKESELIQLIEELREEFPKEIEKANLIIKERDNIFQNAQNEAGNIIKQAQNKAAQLIEETEIVIKAREQSQEILNQTQQQQDDILKETYQQSQQLKSEAENYVNQCFDQLISQITNALTEVQQARNNLNDARNILQQSKI